MVSGKEASPHISAVYLPCGTYRVTATLTIARSTGGLLVGDGETTRLLWDGARGGVMLVSEGLTRMRFVGLHLDGASLADVGIEHDAHSTAPYYGFFETRIRHQNNKFANFGVAGIRVGFYTGTGKLETSEVRWAGQVFAVGDGRYWQRRPVVTEYPRNGLHPGSSLTPPHPPPCIVARTSHLLHQYYL